MGLNDKLYKLRKEKGLTQSDLADKLGVSRQSVSNWEVGSVVPSTKRLKDLSHLYGVPLNYLLDEDSSEEQEVVPLKETKECDAVTPNSGIKQKKRWLLVIAIVVILLTLAIFVVIHINKNSEEKKKKKVLMNELSNEEVETDPQSDFDFN